VSFLIFRENVTSFLGVASVLKSGIMGIHYTEMWLDCTVTACTHWNLKLHKSSFFKVF